MGNLKESLNEASNLKFKGPKTGEKFFESFESIRLIDAVITYLSFVLLNLLGRLQDFLRKVGVLKNSIAQDPLAKKGFVPLFSDYEAFYTRNLYRRVRDCWNRPISSSPGVEIDVMNRESPDHGWSFKFDGKTKKAINMGSYNYLGFGSTRVPWMNDCRRSVNKYGISTCSSRLEHGSLNIHTELENSLAEFLGQEAAIVTSMGFATNSLNMPCIFDKDTCIISDELNHSSLILGCRLSGSTIKKFKHNDMRDLERVLRDTVIYGRPRTRRLYKRIFIVVEGIYSMEGSIVHLPELIELKKKYKAYIYLDEAHSIGALGPEGRGVIDYYGCNPKDVDVVMGTFTKSFGATGGYLAGSKRLIDYVRANSLSSHYGIAMPPVITQQILSCLRVIMEKDVPGLVKYHLEKLRWNTRYFRARCHELGLVVFGNRDSPVVPVITYMPAKLIAFSRNCLSKGLAVVVVGFPATGILLSRVRFCISASHNKESLDKAIEIIKEVIAETRIDFSRQEVPDWCKKALQVRAPMDKEFNRSLHDLYNMKDVYG